MAWIDCDETRPETLPAQGEVVLAYLPGRPGFPLSTARYTRSGKWCAGGGSGGPPLQWRVTKWHPMVPLPEAPPLAVQPEPDPQVDKRFNQLGAKLRSLRESRGIPLWRLARELGLDERRLRAWENGQEGLRVSTLAKVLARLGAKWADLD